MNNNNKSDKKCEVFPTDEEVCGVEIGTDGYKIRCNDNPEDGYFYCCKGCSEHYSRKELVKVKIK